MEQIHRIMFPTDFSEASGAAIPWAVTIASLTSAEIYLVHVLREPLYSEPDPNYHFQVPEYIGYLEADAREELRKLAERFPEHIKTHELLIHGKVTEQLLAMVEAHHIDLIVMSTRGETGWRSLLFGSVAEEIIKLANCPVLSVREPASHRAGHLSDDPDTAA